jgi:uncharacterized protein DUF3105
VAKKARTPPPPRKVQAPKQRQTGGGGLSPERRRLILYGLAGGAAIAVVVVLVVVLSGGGGGTSPATDNRVAAAMEAAGCTFTSKPVLPPKDGKNFHADSPTLKSKVKWSTFPPSGGGHYPLWAVWGFYKDPVNPRMVVHNEEHGGVIIWWGPKVPASTVSKLESFYLDDPTGMFGTPIAGLGNKVALTAWTGDPNRYYRNGYYGIGKLATCPGFDEKAFTTFRDAYKGHGPEGIPLSADQQGMGPNS